MLNDDSYNEQAAWMLTENNETTYNQIAGQSIENTYQLCRQC